MENLIIVPVGLVVSVISAVGIDVVMTFIFGE